MYLMLSYMHLYKIWSQVNIWPSFQRKKKGIVVQATISLLLLVGLYVSYSIWHLTMSVNKLIRS